MNTYTIYCHTFPNGKMYFGQTTNRKTEYRWRSDGSGYKNQPLMWNAIQKYGWDNIDHRIISTGLDKDEADFQEMFYISAYRTNEREFGYNITNGGEGSVGYKHTEDSKQKMSNSKKGKTTWSKGKIRTKEHCQNLSNSLKGRISPRKGAHLSEETKAKLRKPKSENTKQKLRKPKEKFKWLTSEGEIKEMDRQNVERWHPDWKEVIK